MKQKGFDESAFEKIKLEIEQNAIYTVQPPKKKTHMTASEMGSMLGLKKTERYWLLHKHFFEWEELVGKYRINIESFEKWYANQVKYKKVNGEEPGKELRAWSYSIDDLTSLLELSDGVVYDLIKANNIETVVVDFVKRVPKKAFDEWYRNQSRYRTTEDKEKDAAIENATISMPEMARHLGITRNQVYYILNSARYKEYFEIVIVADRKRITRKSFELFLEKQSKYKLLQFSEYHHITEKENTALSKYQGKDSKLKNQKFITIKQAADLAHVTRGTINYWITMDYFSIVQAMGNIRVHTKEFLQFLNEKQSREE